jgi:MYXO-CTERM domain-containing protein
VVDGDAAIGTCDQGAQGDTRTFGPCESDEDCDSGLCERGVCSRPCDADQHGCPDGFTCNEEQAPAGEAGGQPGICVPESCQADHNICDKEAGFFCTYSPTGNYVCAKEGKPLCGCSTSGAAEGGPWSGMVVLVGGLGVLLVPRQRR